ncbi:MAG: rod shape-determining protein [Deltaproteobacteria bacterium]|nr:rod shape-determining protein [Deltaproteobacteria bacterium]|tara:strand:- start:842 stop:1870 length:1029 start_codon:yes stop_codon:yes gene_type:complete
MINSVFGAMSCDMAIDMGTFHTRIHVKGRDDVAIVPSAVSILHGRNGERRILAVGEEAWQMLGRTPKDVQVVRPIRDGLITEFDVAEALLRHQMVKIQGRRLWVGPRVAICIPYGTTEVEKRAVRELAEAAGAREVHLIEQPLAAAAGAGLPITEACGQMVIDVGAGKTQIAVISLGGIVYSRCVKVGGDHMDSALIRHIEKHYGVSIGVGTSNTLKNLIGTALPEANDRSMVIKGRDLDTGFPRAVEIAQVDVGAALQVAVQLIVDAVIASMEHTPPDLASDIAGTGIVLTGGGAKLSGLDRAIGHATGLAVVIAEEPTSSTVRGAALALQNQQILRAAVG